MQSDPSGQQAEGENRARPPGAVGGRDRAAHRFDESLGDGETEAGAGQDAVALLGAIKFFEDLFHVAGRNAIALVDDLEIGPRAVMPGVDRNQRPPAAYFAALSRRLNKTWSNKTASSLSMGILESRLISIWWRARSQPLAGAPRQPIR